MLLFRKLLKISLFLFLIGIIGVVAFYFSIKEELPSVDSLKEIKWETPMQVFSADGKLISQFGEKKRIPLTLDEVPVQLLEALLATEDDRFYQHFGVDPIGMGRAVLGKLMGQNKGGASTITMQVARNFFLTREQTYTRKIREIFLSFHIESLLTKKEIFELYLNKIELGHRAFGFGAAAQVYYGKTVDELTLAQIAVLAGLPKAPSTMNPISSPSRAKDRRAVVLKRMLVSGYITEKQYKTANEAPITAKRHGAEIELSAPYVAEMAHQEMLARYGKKEAYSEGFKVYTTVISNLQQSANLAVTNNLSNYDQRHGYRGAIKSLRPELTDLEHTNEAKKESPLTNNEMDNALKQIESYQSLVPAVVMYLEEKVAAIYLGNKSVGIIEWQGMAWAREYINDNKQGPAPQTAADILATGDIVFVEHIEKQKYKLSQLPKASAALVSLSPDNGAILSAVGGYSFKQSQFNRVTQAKRQIGSNVKPFLYSAALDNGYTLASLINDAPINKWDKRSGVVWRPKNSPERYDGPIRIRSALAQSKNVIAVRLLRAIGLDKTIDHLSLFGFSPDELPRNESLALGSASFTPLEVATGFAVFANGGYLIEPYIIERIEDNFGNVLYEASPPLACEVCENKEEQQNTILEEIAPKVDDIVDTLLATDPIPLVKKKLHSNKAERVISKQNAFLITEALNTAIWGPTGVVTGWRAKTLQRKDIAGKTGTTNEAKDAWFSGYSRRIVTTSWIGFDDPSKSLGKTTYNANLGKNQVTGKEFGAKSAQPAWIAFMKTALANKPIEPFKQPENLLSVRIDKKSGKLTTQTDNSSMFEYFIKGSEPTNFVIEDNAGMIIDGDTTSIVENLF